MEATFFSPSSECLLIDEEDWKLEKEEEEDLLFSFFFSVTI